MPDNRPELLRPELLRGVVHPWHHDIFGHMNVRHYAPFFDDASFFLYAAMDISINWLIEEFGIHIVSAKAETNFIKELVAGDGFIIDGAVSRIGRRSVTFHQRMTHVETGALHATYNLTEVFFDPKTRKSAPMPDEVRQRLTRHLLPE
ncbi:acyl-CoA thioesterase [Pararhodobacter oceanensis]|uniref:acyl-CoA thioesterase n=1 Tax=Pararhodobacter oceanensis TaxID=2172121 RepID=UPI003A8DD50E